MCDFYNFMCVYYIYTQVFVRYNLDKYFTVASFDLKDFKKVRL